MDFQFSGDQRLLKKTVRDFAERELKPHAREWDEKQEFPREIFTKLGELGLLAVVFPEEYGGSGMSTVDYTIVIEELARIDAGVALSTAAHNSLSSGHIFLAGTEEQKKKYLPKLATGEWVRKGQPLCLIGDSGTGKSHLLKVLYAMLEATAVDIDDEDDPADVIAQLRAARQSLAGPRKR